MEKGHKDLLRRNMVAFGNDLQVTPEFINYLDQGAILSRHDVETLQNPTTTRSEKASWLMRQLSMKGPSAFDVFYNSLVDTDQDHLADTLKDKQYRLERWRSQGRALITQPSDQSGRSVHAQETVTLPQEWPCLDTLADKVQVIDVDDDLMKQKFREGQTDDHYKMSSNPRGRALIFNIEHFYNEDRMEDVSWRREASSLDQESLLALFRDLYFKCLVHKDFTAEDILDKLKEEQQDKRHNNFDSFVLIILSHGNDGDIIYGSDKKPVNMKDVRAMFNGDNCQHLVAKPKLFIIQACKGGGLDKGKGKEEMVVGVSAEGNPVVNAEDESLLYTWVKEIDIADANPPQGTQLETPQTALRQHRSVPRDADQIVINATTPEMVSYRDTRLGSWFIQAIVYVFMNKSHSEDLQSMITKVNALVSKGETIHGHKQVSSTESTLRRKVYFFPGLTM